MGLLVCFRIIIIGNIIIKIRNDIEHIIIIKYRLQLYKAANNKCVPTPVFYILRTSWTVVYKTTFSNINQNAKNIVIDTILLRSPCRNYLFFISPWNLAWIDV